MKVAVGSENPVKIACVKLAFEAVWPDKQWEIVSCKTESGVAAQPMSDVEAIKGAINRAQQARKHLNADYGIGLEGGIQQIGKLYYDGGWIVVLDRDNRRGVGGTVKAPIPTQVMQLVHAGKEFGEALDIFFKEDNMKQKHGFFGRMTNNSITRTTAYRDAVIIALAPFIHADLFEK